MNRDHLPRNMFAFLTPPHSPSEFDFACLLFIVRTKRNIDRSFSLYEHAAFSHAIKTRKTRGLITILLAPRRNRFFQLGERYRSVYSFDLNLRGTKKQKTKQDTIAGAGEYSRKNKRQRICQDDQAEISDCVSTRRQQKTATSV